MAGTREGALKARQVMIDKHGADYYAIIGAVGGRNGNTGGFYNNPELAREAGKKGGKISRRGKRNA